MRRHFLISLHSTLPPFYESFIQNWFSHLSTQVSSEVTANINPVNSNEKYLLSAARQSLTNVNIPYHVSDIQRIVSNER